MINAFRISVPFTIYIYITLKNNPSTCYKYEVKNSAKLDDFDCQLNKTRFFIKQNITQITIHSPLATVFEEIITDQFVKDIGLSANNIDDFYGFDHTQDDTAATPFFGLYQTLTDKIVKKEKIGYGAGGKVFKVTIDGRDYALKQIEKKKTDAVKWRYLVQELVSIIKCVYYKIPYIQEVYGMYESDTDMYILSKLYTDGTLFDKYRKLKNINVWKIAKQVATALHKLHEKNIYHRDIKLENIMLQRVNDAGEEPDYNAFIIDFGYSRGAHLTGRKISEVGTFPYNGTPDNIFQQDLFPYTILICELMSKKRSPDLINEDYWKMIDDQHEPGLNTLDEIRKQYIDKSHKSFIKQTREEKSLTPNAKAFITFLTKNPPSFTNILDKIDDLQPDDLQPDDLQSMSLSPPKWRTASDPSDPALPPPPTPRNSMHKPSQTK